MRIYDVTLSGESIWTAENDGNNERQENDAMAYFKGLDLASEEYTKAKNLPIYSSYIDSFGKYDLYYNYGADYYFIVKE